MKIEKHRLGLIILIIISEAVYLLLYADIFPGAVTFTMVSLFNSVLYLLMSKVLGNTENSRNLAIFLLISGMIIRISLIFLPPTASDDIYRYLWDGKVQANGINPYKYAPAAPELRFLHSDTLPEKVNFREMKTIYPPFAQYVFFISYKIWGESPAGFKSIILLFEALTLLFLYFLLKRMKIEEKYLAYYSLCPLPVMQFAVDGHVDATGISMLLAGLLLFFSRKTLFSSIAFGLSIASKLISAMILPFLNDEKKLLFRIKSALFALVPALIFYALTYLPYFNSNVNPFESLKTFTVNWVFNGSVFSLIFEFLDHNQKSRLICAALLGLTSVLIFISKKEPRDKIYYMILSFLLLSPTVHPWYVCWLAVLLPLNAKLSGIIYVCLVNLANYVVVGYVLNGKWVMPDFILWMEYLPVYIALVYDLTKDSGFKNISFLKPRGSS